MEVWWIVVAAVAVGLLVLALAVSTVVRRVPRLMRAAAVLHRRQAESVALRESAERLQERMLTLQDQAERTQQRIAAISVKHGE